jgi:hypothetical protein
MLKLDTHTRAELPQGHPPVLTVVVDTEEEFDWSQPFSRNSVGVTSIAAQPLMHERVFDHHGVVPTYVIDWPVATTPSAVEVLKGLMQEGKCEIGTHLHPWVSPPHTEEINAYNSYAGNLPRELEFEKIKRLTQAITDNFGRAPVVFKAGRYGVGPHTSAILSELGYRVDASVVPFTAMTADGGPDFSRHGADPFWFGEEGKRLLELPATAGYAGTLHAQGVRFYPWIQTAALRRLRVPGVASRLGLLERIKLSPEGYSLDELKSVTRCLVSAGTRFFGLTYHSPTVIPGHTAYTKTMEERERFIKTLNAYLRFFSEEIHGVMTTHRSLFEQLQQDQMVT